MARSQNYKIIKRRSRKHFVVRWHDAAEGRWKERSLGVTRRRDAEDAAVDMIAQEADEPILCDPTSWTGFRLKYESEKGPLLANVAVWKSAANMLEKLVALDSLEDVTAAALSQFESKMRAAGLRESTIRTYLKHVRAGMNWAVDVELIRRAPKVRLPKLADDEHARGRAVTGEEFERWLKKLKSLVGPKRYPSWEHLMRGLRLSGLRLDESLKLSWDDDSKILVLNIDGRRPVMQIPARRHKGRRFTVSPMAPEFVQFLRETPVAKRVGYVFNPAGKKTISRSRDYVGRPISEAGTAANIVVARDDHRVKCASAQDLRRSFGDRWAQLVMPVVLKELMRHRSIETTMRYYVGREAEQTADILWSAVAVTKKGDAKGDTRLRSNRQSAKNC